MVARFPIVLNVRDYGAAGDGVTDDRQAIQAAIGEACKACKGAMLRFPLGLYRISNL